MLKHRETYEIMRPEDVGFSRTQLVLGKHSGRHALRESLANLGHELDDAQLDDVFTRFKTLADKKREVFESDLDALALGLDPEAVGPWRLQHLHATTHLGNGASASVKLKHTDGRVAAEAALGDGPVHAVLRAITRAAGMALDIDDFQIRSLSNGADAQGRATLTVHYNDRELCGRGVSTDIVEAAGTAEHDRPHVGGRHLIRSNQFQAGGVDLVFAVADVDFVYFCRFEQAPGMVRQAEVRRALGGRVHAFAFEH